jgi:hypothetical protein
MATWKKVIVSGSLISQLDNDRNYVSSTGGGILSSSAQIATNISGAFTSTSASIATDIAANTTSIATNVTNIGTLTSQTSSYALKTQITGAFTDASASIASDIAALQGAVGSGGTLISSSVEGDAQGQIKFNGINVDANNLGTGDSPTFTNLTLTGDLTVQGDVTSLQTTNVNVEDQFVLVNSGSAAADGGLVINGAGSAFGWDQSEGRFALDYAGATWNQTAIASDAFVASVVTTDDVNYQKVGNIRINTGSGDIFIYS